MVGRSGAARGGGTWEGPAVSQPKRNATSARAVDLRSPRSSELASEPDGLAAAPRLGPAMGSIALSNFSAAARAARHWRT